MSAQLSDSLNVGIVTCAPGNDIYQLEGHAALHIQGRYQDRPLDVAVNWGLFDFDSPNFVYRFVKGETDYMCGASDWQQFIYPYIFTGRRIVEHPIMLDSLQTARLMALVDDNLQPCNRVYRYNYVKDNCATRPLRMVEIAIGDTITAPQLPGSRPTTFRNVMRRYHANYPWYQFGIDLALGSGIDYPITNREETFAPDVLEQYLDHATVGGSPLSAPAIIVYPGVGSVISDPTPWYLTPMAAACALLVITMALTWRDIRRRKVTRWFDAALYTLYGAAGLVLTFLIFVSVHEATSPNWLYLWLNPLCLLVPLFIWLKKCKIMVFSYQIINFALILTMIVAWPFTGQSGNIAFIPLIGCDLLRSISYMYIYLQEKRA